MGSQTPLYQAHLDAGAKIVDFAGWDMPIHYGSQLDEHHYVRQQQGMFDVSHMTVVDCHGADAKAYLQYLLANDVDKLKQHGKALYSCMLNEQAGVVDDLIVYFLEEAFYRVVINSATRQKDLDWLNSQTDGFSDLSLKVRDDLAMIAVQGPKARATVVALMDESIRESVEALGKFFALKSDELMVARTGYTGEDGFEVMLPALQASAFWQRCIQAGVQPCGLGARDTLRLEAGMNLYGTDMDEQTHPLESGLGWTVAWLPEDRDFVGRDALQAQKDRGIDSRFVGLVLEGKGVLRNHLKVFTETGEGEITSGSFSPTLGKAIAFARIPKGTASQCEVEIRNKRVPASIVKLPFVRDGQSCL